MGFALIVLTFSGTVGARFELERLLIMLVFGRMGLGLFEGLLRRRPGAVGRQQRHRDPGARQAHWELVIGCS